MLRELQVTNFTLVDQVRIEFGQGLNLLTGETGAGKSILIDALGLSLGEKSSGSDQIRVGADKATVEALYDLSDAPESVIRKLIELGVADDDDNTTLLISREITSNGKSVSRINGRLIPLAALRDIASDLIDVHGQHEHQSLLSRERHLLLYDDWLGESATSLRMQAAAEHARLNRLKREQEHIQSESRDRARNLDLYEYQFQEIHDSNLRIEEEEELLSDRNRLANSEKLRASADDAYDSLTEGALDLLNRAHSTIQRSSQIDAGLDPICSSLAEAVSFADDARRELRRYRESLEFNPAKLEEVEDRLGIIQALKRKYGDTIADVIAYGSDVHDKIVKLQDTETLEHELVGQITACESHLNELCAKLSTIRHGDRANFEHQVTAQLADLGMATAKFEMRIESTSPGARGSDDIEFQISTNPGEPIRSLAKVASGGELSRIMLALKSVLARAAFIPTLIFDEIDVGVGGHTAAAIADKLRTLALTCQVLVITHLPQIASRPASAHFAIEKNAASGRTVVSVRALSDESRVEEIVRMLGGDRNSETVVLHAREMLAAK